MKKACTILLLVLAAINTIGQITTTKIAPATIAEDNSPYDSSRNFLMGDAGKYKGQELYLMGKPESLRMYGYEGFVLDYREETTANPSNTYKCCDSYNSKYDDMAGKYFKVLDVIPHPKSSSEDGVDESLYKNVSYLKLQEKSSGDILYYVYNGDFKFNFPFLVVGFFEKQKNTDVGKKFVIADGVLANSTDIQSGKVVTISTGQVWKCTDLTVEEKYYNLAFVIENPLGEKTTIEWDDVYGDWAYGKVYTIAEADNYKKKFGAENFDFILKGKIKIGMSKEMCRLSWGEPKKINETITAGKKSEQWVYKTNYLYFENNVLTTIQ